MNIDSVKWVKRHLDMARHVSEWSKDASTKVGCVIVTMQGLPVSWGYNGFPKGVRDDVPERNERPTKYFYSAHAERNAMDICRRSVEGCVMFVTHIPCSDCAIGIIQNGISKVIVDGANGVTDKENSYIYSNPKWKESVSHTLKMFLEGGVEYKELLRGEELLNVSNLNFAWDIKRDMMSTYER